MAPLGLAAIAFAAAALAVAPAAGAKEFTAFAVAAADGRSTLVRTATPDELFAGRAPAAPRGGYLRVYPLGPTGHVGVPGRFYPETGAICLSWDQAAPPRGCMRAKASLRPVLLRQAGRVRLFQGTGPALGRLESPHVGRPVLGNLRAAFELGFDRSRLARVAARPAPCIPFSGTWRGERSASRPQRFCLAERGAYAGGKLYPLGPAPFRLAFDNRRR